MQAVEPGITDIEQLKGIYTFRQEKSVIKFIQKYPYLLDVLKEAYPQIKKYFPEEPLVLEVNFDREGAEYDQLFIHIQTEQEVKSARANLRSLDEQWWLDNTEAANHKICIHLEYL
jgi:hypothetical protein